MSAYTEVLHSKQDHGPRTIMICFQSQWQARGTCFPTLNVTPINPDVEAHCTGEQVEACLLQHLHLLSLRLQKQQRLLPADHRHPQ